MYLVALALKSSKSLGCFLQKLSRTDFGFGVVEQYKDQDLWF